MTDAEYVEFLASLKRVKKLLKKNDNFEDLGELPEIIQKISLLRTKEILPDVARLLKTNSAQEFQERLNQFFDPYFEAFASDAHLLENIRAESGDFFTLKKGYQLSHAMSIWKSRINGIGDTDVDISNYFLGRLFIDYYETFPLHLFPILKFHEGKRDNELIHLSTDGEARKTLLKNNLGEPKLKVLDRFYTLRNKLSHAGVLFEKDHFCSWETGGKAHKKRIKEELDHFELMMNLFVLFATEFDLRILALAKPENNAIFTTWMEYFDIYVTWFHKNLGRPKPQA